MEDTITRKEAQRLVNAVARQRDEQANARAQLESAFEAARDRIAELEEQLKALRPNNVVDITPQDVEDAQSAHYR